MGPLRQDDEYSVQSWEALRGVQDIVCDTECRVQTFKPLLAFFYLNLGCPINCDLLRGSTFATLFIGKSSQSIEVRSSLRLLMHLFACKVQSNPALMQGQTFV